MAFDDNTPADGRQRTPTLLLVGSEVLVRAALAEYLRACGYRVVEAANAADARIVLTSDAIAVDLVFSEVNLTGPENGFALASWARQACPTIKVLLTATISQSAERAGEVCDEGPLLRRPYSHEALLRQIQSLVYRADSAEQRG